MSIPDGVLELLEGTERNISGEEMASRLGVSRNSIWKAVQKLREEGYEIEAATNRGYALISKENVFNAANIYSRLQGPAKIADINLRETVTSTNTVLKAEAEKGGTEGMVLIAEQQTHGKGRVGRTFYSPKGTGLYLSILLRPKFSAEESLSITTAAAVAVAGAVEEVTGRRTAIKWVNDVYLDGYKICGILTEASLDFETSGLDYAVLGIGVNIRRPQDGFSEELKNIAGAIYDDDPPSGTRVALAAEILNRFFAYYQNLTSRTFMSEYKRRSLLTGMKINFVHGGERMNGTVLGIDDDAHLLVRLEDGEQVAFTAGEVAIDKDFLSQLHNR